MGGLWNLYNRLLGYGAQMSVEHTELFFMESDHPLYGVFSHSNRGLTYNILFFSRAYFALRVLNNITLPKLVRVQSGSFSCPGCVDDVIRPPYICSHPAAPAVSDCLLVPGCTLQNLVSMCLDCQCQVKLKELSFRPKPQS